MADAVNTPRHAGAPGRPRRPPGRARRTPRTCRSCTPTCAATCPAATSCPAPARCSWTACADLDAARAYLAGWVPSGAAADREGRLVELPTSYDGPDLDDVARRWDMTRAEAVATHTGTELTVAFVGFAPGFAYCTGLPAELSVPRLDRPRAKVPAGSVGLAGEYTGVYPTVLARRLAAGRPHRRAALGRRPRRAGAADARDPGALRGGVRVSRALTVLEAGPLTTIQDAGRPGPRPPRRPALGLARRPGRPAGQPARRQRARRRPPGDDGRRGGPAGRGGRHRRGHGGRGRRAGRRARRRVGRAGLAAGGRRAAGRAGPPRGAQLRRGGRRPRRAGGAGVAVHRPAVRARPAAAGGRAGAARRTGAPAATGRRAPRGGGRRAAPGAARDRGRTG